MKIATLVIAVSLSAMIQVPAHAAGGPKIPECQAPFAACQAAGFKVGAHKKGDKEGTDNGLWVDCINAVADGKKQVAGVDQTAAQACKDKMKAQRQSK